MKKKITKIFSAVISKQRGQDATTLLSNSAISCLLPSTIVNLYSACSNASYNLMHASTRICQYLAKLLFTEVEVNSGVNVYEHFWAR